MQPHKHCSDKAHASQMLIACAVSLQHDAEQDPGYFLSKCMISDQKMQDKNIFDGRKAYCQKDLLPLLCLVVNSEKGGILYFSCPPPDGNWDVHRPLADC